jgi:hypothetical protein
LEPLHIRALISVATRWINTNEQEI